MSKSSITTEGQAVNAALARFRLATSSASDQDLIDKLVFLTSVARQAEDEALRIIAQLDSDGTGSAAAEPTSTTW